MKRVVFVFLILFLTKGNIFPSTLSIDSLKYEVINNPNDTSKLKSLKKLSQSFLAIDADSAMQYVNKMLLLAKEKQILYYISDAFDLQSTIYEDIGKLDKCIVAIDSAKYYAQLIHDPIGVIYFATNKGSIYMKMGRYFEALQSFYEVEEVGNRINRPSRVAAALNNIGAVYHYLGDDETSLDFFIKSYKLRVENNLTEKLAYSLNNIGAVYSKYGNYDEALEYHKKALQTALAQNDKYNYLVSMINIGLDFDLLNDFDSSLKYYKQALVESKNQDDRTSQAHILERLSAIFVENDDLVRAKSLLEKALIISNESGNMYDIASFSNSMGTILLKQGKFKEALPLFTVALNIAKQINASIIEANAYKSLAAYNYSINNLLAAFKYNKLYYAKRDSLYKAETELKIANLKNRFELNQKQRELELKDVELKSEKIVSSNRLSTIYIIGLTVIILFFLLIYIMSLYRKIWYQKKIISESQTKVIELLEKETELSNLKTELISTVSHEFRTPLAIISSNVQLIRDFDSTMNSDMRQETIAYVSSGVENLIAMMKNFEVLDKNTMLEFRPGVICLSKLISNITNELHSLPQYKGRIVFISSFSNNEVLMDGLLITHILRNLLINALKFSFGKKVELKLDKLNSEKVEISVIDKGIGMSTLDKERIFDNFHRGTNVESVKGTGIGMSVVKRCVELHNGNILVESSLGKGTEITVALPFKKLT